MADDPSQNTPAKEEIYEMLWDCEYCSATSLLGQTHRYCPSCGAKQNPEKRYFPNEEQKVRAKNSVYNGADRICPACGTATSAASAHCPGCGSALEGAATAKLITDKLPEKKRGEGPSGIGKKKILLAAGLFAVVGIVLFLLFNKKEIVLTASGHEWESSIVIERMEEHESTGNCDHVPSSAFGVVSLGTVREGCHTERTDRGDGTFSESEVCDEYEKCRYTVRDWNTYRTLSQTGGLNDPVRWPVASVTGGSCEGCTREGRRNLDYTVRFQDGEGDGYSCDFSSPEPWERVLDGRRYKTMVNMLNMLDCDRLLEVE